MLKYKLEQADIDLLVQKWSNTAELGALSIESLDESIKPNMAILMENQDSFKSMNAMLAESFTNSTTSIGELGSNAAYKPISLALVRRTFPVLFAQKCVGVQPMSTPVGLAYALRFIYNDIAGVNGPEAAWDQVPIYSGFTGSTSGTSATYSTSGAGTGVDTSVAEAWKMGSTYPQMKLILDQTSIIAKSRKIGASFSIESAQDINAMHNINIMQEIVKVLQYEIIAEMDREILATLKTTAISGTGAAGAKYINLNATSGTTFVDGRWSQEQISSLVTSIVYQAEKIADSTRRGAGNFVVVSPAVAAMLRAARPNFTGNETNVKQAQAGIAEIGNLNGGISVYRDHYATNDYALVGYKGPEQSDCGVILSPYVTNVMNTAIDPEDFSTKVGCMSRYAITNSLLGSGRYYRYMDIQGASKVIAGY
jgi:hypothetical protein